MGLCILNPLDYENMCKKHLDDISTYKICSDYEKKIPAIWKKLLHILNTYDHINIKDGKIHYSQLAKSLLQLKDTNFLRISPFYCLPKIHKNTTPIPGRPIISSPGSITYFTSSFLDKTLQPIIRKFKTICLSSKSVLPGIYTINNNFIIPKEAVILCADVASLYPSIPIEFGLNAFKEFFNNNNNFGLSTKFFNFIYLLLEFVLKNNYCIFDNTTYKQITGTAMGTPVAVSYSNIVLLYIESKIASFNQLYYKRYIDDIFGIFYNYDDAISYTKQFNSICPSIQLEQITIGKSGVFLDLEFYITNNGIIEHKIFQKSISKFQYIPPFSFHKKSIITNWITNEFIRYKLYCSNNEDYESIASAFSVRLIARGYSIDLIAIIKALVPPRNIIIDKTFAHKFCNSNKTADINIFINTSRHIQIPDIKSLLQFFNDKSDYINTHTLTNNNSTDDTDDTTDEDNNTSIITNNAWQLLDKKYSQKNLLKYITNTILIANKSSPSLSQFLVSSKYVSKES
jgi:hypothetical protein